MNSPDESFDWDAARQEVSSNYEDVVMALMFDRETLDQALLAKQNVDSVDANMETFDQDVELLCAFEEQVARNALLTYKLYLDAVMEDGE